MGMNLEIEIQQLILHGLPASDAVRIKAAITDSLVTILQRDGISESLIKQGSVETMQGEFRVNPGSSPENIGAHVAKAVARGLTR